MRARAPLLLSGWLLGLAWTAAAQPSDPKTAHFSSDPNAHKISIDLLILHREAAEGRRSLAGETRAADEATLVEAIFSRESPGAAAPHFEARDRLNLPGVRLIHFSERYGRATLALADLARLFDLAAIPELMMIQPVYGAVTHAGAVTSRANAAMNVEVGRLGFLLDGRGVTVGIISNSFARGSDVRDADTQPPLGIPGRLTGSRPQDSGDLPAEARLLRDDFDRPDVFTGEDEGAAMAELFHDLAPGADIAFHTAFPSQAVFADAVARLVDEAGASVLVDDVLYLNEPMYEPGIPARAAAEAVARGVAFFSAAGNLANAGLRMNYVDIDPANDDTAFPTPTGVDLHDWGGGDPFLAVTILPASRLRVVLQWNQPFQSLNAGRGSRIDLDLYMTSIPDVAALANPVARSVNLQGNAGQPRGDAFETIEYLNVTSNPQTFHLSIDHFQGSQTTIPEDSSTPLEFRLVFISTGGVTVEGISDGTAAFGAPTIYGHAAIEPPIVVGAVPWFDTPAFDTATVGTPLMDPEAFTSRGGMLPMHFDAPGAFSMSSTFKPDVAAVDGNNTTFFGNDLGPGAPFGENDGFPNFFGTSASAPNAAAVAALALELEPRLTPAEIKDLMRQTAVDVQGFRAAPGDDDVTGAGLVDGVTLLNAIAGTEREGGKQRPILIREIKEGRCYHEYLGAPDVELSDRTFVDFYSLDWPGGDLEISLSSEQADAYLVVFEPPGEPSGVRRDINEGTIGAEVYSAIDAPAGTYTIWANTFERQSGAYRLHVNCLEPISSTVKNPSLEDGDDGDWTVFSTRPSSSVCESSACGSAGGTAGPRSGDWWIWFGRLRVMGAPSVVERSRVEQEIRISRGTATLEFYLWLGAASGNGLDRLDASVDGSVVFSVLAGNAAFSAGYAPVRVDLSKFADGSNHRVRFEATLRPGAAATNISIDDVRLLVCGPPAAARHWSRYR